MMKRVLFAAGAAVTTIAAVAVTSPVAYARPAPPPVTNVTATITCATNTSGGMAMTPVDANDYATGAPLLLGCGQFGPASASEPVTAGTVSYNYNGYYYPIGASATTACGPGASHLGHKNACHSKGASITFQLSAS